MLTTPLLHPQLLEAIASLGHGSRILIADGNYPFRTAVGPNARIVYLNLAPGMFSVDQVLSVLTQSVPFESVVMMDAPIEAPVQDQVLDILDDGIMVERVERSDFYELARGADTGLLIATGEQRVYANVLLTIGVV
ncbi:RbsD/FucU family protein [Microbacterium hatanonis]|uniref:RbsD or FucU transport n=1 Tax=Microbacterium hatanonis TaxID=404366 RepID=A0A5C8HV07_9MICO|nr:RbsD/FucU family protein [Microbacterium hatanonis]TXK09728.1 RbsD or FucU transport [Microbacterium hatanonis]